MVAFVDGTHAFNQPAEYPYQLQEDRELLRLLGPLTVERADIGQYLIRTITTQQTSYRVLVVPVTIDGGSSGALVLAFDRTAEHTALADTYRTYAFVALGAVVLIGALGFLIVSDLLKPIALLRSAAATISSTDLSRRIAVVGNDDLAVLTSTVNGMLDRIEHAFSSQRELLDDVGHELRTPLTVVRGHLELMDPHDPEDAAAARAIALDELDRMNALVEELMTLAKSRRPDFVTPEPTDVAVLTDEVLTKARPLGERRWTLDSLAVDAVIALDPRRITQAWLQLANNAVKFSHEGSVVALGSAADEEHVRLWVRDEGVGIAPDDQERIFERFARADTGGVEGSGLGLTIVQSIAEAHGGRVELASRQGEGSTFTIVLPRETTTTERPSEQKGDR
jgi:two-component system OmpR family sensor kinase